MSIAIIGLAQQKIDIPASYSNIKIDENSNFYLQVDGAKMYEVAYQNPLELKKISGNIQGFAKGLYFDFKDEEFTGKLIYGFIPYGDSRHPHPVYFRSSSEIVQGKTTINIAGQLRGTYDMIGWEKSGKGTIGYRVVDSSGRILYDGKVSFKGTGPFKVDVTIVEGPFINLLKPDGATISFTTNMSAAVSVNIDGKVFNSSTKGQQHVILVNGLKPQSTYNYTVHYGNSSQTYSFTTAPVPGSKTAFTFAYASDSRSGNGGGERDIHGANAYIMKKIMALGHQQGISFMQFTGDMINGYRTSAAEMDLQYSNWKHAIEPFAHYFPVYAAMGNHEALSTKFSGSGGGYTIDRFPFATESAEAVFARNFVNPLNGPDSEDGASYDPKKKTTDFPSYKENVFYYTYDNVAMIVLNSDYWYAPSTAQIPVTSGGLHGYIMDNQLAWLEETVATLEADPNIDHVFVTQHTPCFPNGGHVRDDMWYNGNNDYRPYVAGKPLDKGIVERRDQILDILVNKSSKVIAVLTGDEHNYAKTEIGPNTTIYNKAWDQPRLELSRTIYQINNGAAGAPYYAQEQTPWSASVSGFTTQNALVLFHVEGKKIFMEVLNPDTLEKVDELQLR
jgi:hypothetical protein